MKVKYEVKLEVIEVNWTYQSDKEKCSFFPWLKLISVVDNQKGWPKIVVAHGP